MRSFALSLFVLSLFYSSTALSDRTDCPKAKVEMIQIEGSIIHYKQLGAPWRHLGNISNEGTKIRHSALLAAQMANKDVIVGYPKNNYDCTKENYGISAYIVRTYKD
ncbi:hypothetical protein SOPP22_01395 [Shewanella sp. OPT22]|nr:hypothetical protein SOPP22_01395 [Shewanella sp. OPT22]